MPPFGDETLGDGAIGNPRVHPVARPQRIYRARSSGAQDF